MSYDDADFFLETEFFDEDLVEEASKVPSSIITDKESYKSLHTIQKRTLGLFILKLLRNKARYGYEIKQAIQDEFNVNTSQISTYKTLYKLSNEGLVTCRIIEPIGANSNRTRKYYFITPLGVKLLMEAQKFMKNFYQILFGKKSNQDLDF